MCRSEPPLTCDLELYVNVWNIHSFVCGILFFRSMR